MTQRGKSGREPKSPAWWRARLEGRPLPGAGAAPPWSVSTGDDAYEAAGESLALALLLDLTAERERDPSGFDAADNNKLWEAAKERWPGLDDWR